MLKRLLLALLLVILCSVTNAQGERKWTLDDCLKYAEDHSIDIQRQALVLEKEELALDETRWAFIPSFSVSSGYTASTGRVLDPTTYQFVQTNLTGNSNSSVSGDVSIFEGGRKVLALQKAKLSLRAAVLQEKSIRNNLLLNVTAAYLDVLCAGEQIKIAEQSASIVEAQLELSKIRLNAGSITESDVLQLQSQLFAAQSDIASAKHSEQIARLSLCDLLEIDDYESFTVAEPQDDIGGISIIDIDAAIDNHPRYEASILGQSLALFDYKIAQSALYPKVSLSAGYGSSFSDARKKTIQDPDGTFRYEAYPFFQQYADNASAYVSVSLRIPILTGLSVRDGVKRARIASNDAELSVQETRKQLRRQILQAQLDCQAAEDRYNRTIEEVRYSEEALRQINEKYNLGTTDYLTWSTALAELIKARYSLIEAKYSYILKEKILGMNLNY